MGNVNWGETQTGPLCPLWQYNVLPDGTRQYSETPVISLNQTSKEAGWLAERTNNFPS